MTQRAVPPVERIWVTIAKHCEPRWRSADLSFRRSYFALRRSACIAIVRRCDLNSSGSAPRYTFFLPKEEYDPTLIEPLEKMVRKGKSDVGVRLHRDGEVRQNFIDCRKLGNGRRSSTVVCRVPNRLVRR